MHGIVHGDLKPGMLRRTHRPGLGNHRIFCGLHDSRIFLPFKLNLRSRLPLF
jgi:hypothetical protein